MHWKPRQGSSWSSTKLTGKPIRQFFYWYRSCHLSVKCYADRLSEMAYPHGYYFSVSTPLIPLVPINMVISIFLVCLRIRSQTNSSWHILALLCLLHKFIISCQALDLPSFLCVVSIFIPNKKHYNVKSKRLQVSSIYLRGVSFFSEWGKIIKSEHRFWCM